MECKTTIRHSAIDQELKGKWLMDYRQPFYLHNQEAKEIHDSCEKCLNQTENRHKIGMLRNDQNQHKITRIDPENGRNFQREETSKRISSHVETVRECQDSWLCLQPSKQRTDGAQKSSSLCQWRNGGWWGFYGTQTGPICWDESWWWWCGLLTKHWLYNNRTKCFNWINICFTSTEIKDRKTNQWAEELPMAAKDCLAAWVNATS